MTATLTTLGEIDGYTPKQTAEILEVLLAKLETRGWNEMSVDEQVQLRLLKTLLSGFA
jgi:hypothetical protein